MFADLVCKEFYHVFSKGHPPIDQDVLVPIQFQLGDLKAYKNSEIIHLIPLRKDCLIDLTPKFSSLKTGLFVSIVYWTEKSMGG